MNFARHIGDDKRFTKGKVYPIWTEMDSTDAVSSKFIEISRDDGEIIRLEAKQEVDDKGKTRNLFPGFEFVEEVYAVIVKPFDDFKLGQVVVVDDVESSEGKKDLVYSIKGVGYRNSDCVVLLDGTNVFPGMMVQEEASGRWVKIKSVDECLWVVTEDNPGRRSPEEFQFAVDVDGDIAVVPLVECVDAVGIENLTKGKRYSVIWEEKMMGDQKLLRVVDDSGKENAYLASRFKF